MRPQWLAISRAYQVFFCPFRSAMEPGLAMLVTGWCVLCKGARHQMYARAPVGILLVAVTSGAPANVIFDPGPIGTGARSYLDASGRSPEALGRS